MRYRNVNKKTTKYLRYTFVITSLIAIIVMFSLISIYALVKLQGPPETTVTQSTVYYSSDGAKIGESHFGQKRYWVPFEQISPWVIQATVAIEDKRFYQHNGFDLRRIGAAILVDLKSMAKVQGASTITQQYARNLYLTHEKSWFRKGAEAYYTLRLEANYEKKRIIEGYLNTIYYGHGAYGIEAAAQYYFGKSARDLSLSEASLLVGIPKGPSVFSPLINFNKSKERQHLVLKTMENQGYISKAEVDNAKNKPFTFVKKKQRDNFFAPYFIDEVKKQLSNNLKLNSEQIEKGGLRVYTTLDTEAQSIAEKTVKQEVAVDSEVQLAVVSIDPATGNVRALMGGKDYKASPFNRATQAIRQPGSTMKPLLYYAALENGFTPATTMKSEYTSFLVDEKGKSYKPSNYNNYYADDFITMAQAIAVSDNVYAVKTHLFLGEDTLINTAKKLGINSPMQKVPSLALGTSPVRVIDMVNAYGILANGGKEIEPNFIERVEDNKGNVIYTNDKKYRKQLLKKSEAFVTTQLMTGMFDSSLNSYTPVTGAGIAKMLSRPYAGKSGSTNTDSWMIGYTPQLVTGVWVGYDKGKLLELARDKVLSRNLWAKIMEETHRDKKIVEFTPPKDVVGVYIDPINGKVATKNCKIKRLVYFKAGTEPSEPCEVHPGSELERQKKEKEPHKKGSFFDSLKRLIR
ncbi:MAG: pbpG [Bacillales bacterium]|jgi:1A family penicillin-binding protein|nr:pbpG [Bacillales bacterium]